MSKATERITISLTKVQIQRLEELKDLFGEKTYSKVIGKLISHVKL